jgi:predicted  nucleic acid-binding Zn-ribbon protein
VSAIDDLVSLQDQDGIVRDLERQLKDIPVRKEQEMERIRLEQNAVEHAKAELAGVRADIAEAEANAEAKRAQIRNLETAKLSMKTNREFSEANATLVAMKEDLTKLEDACLEEQERIEPAEKALAEANERLAAAKAEIDDYLKELDERLAEAKKDLEEAVRVRAELAAPLQTPAARRFLMAYERLSKGKWPALVKVEDRVCQGCHMELPASKVQDIARSANPVVCEYCGRMVY